MKIVSWNLNGLIATIDNDALSQLPSIAPDVVCLQEIRTKKEPEILPGFLHYWNHALRDGYSGTAMLLTQKPIRVINGFLSGQPDEEGRIMTAELPECFIVNAYVPNSQKNLKRHAYRLQWDAMFREHIRELMEDKPVIVCGDFNVAREAIDIYGENMRQFWAEQGYASDERSNFETLLELGLVDVFRELHPDKRSYTWWSNRLNKRKEDRGWRLDYFLVTDCLFPSVLSMEHLANVSGSDHCPIVMEVSL